MVGSEMTKQVYWKTRTGVRVPIKQLEDGYLVNIIRMLERMAGARKREAEAWGPPSFGGEMAQLCAENEYETLYEAEVEDIASEEFPVYTPLVEEALRRQLTWEPGA